MGSNDGSFTPDADDEDEEPKDADTPRVNCPDCAYNESILDPRGPIQWYCPECGGRCTVQFTPRTPQHVHSYRLS